MKVGDWRRIDKFLNLTQEDRFGTFFTVMNKFSNPMNSVNPEEIDMVIRILQKSNLNKSNILIATKILTNWDYHENLTVDGI